MCAYCKAKVEARTTCCDRVFRAASDRLGLNLVAPTTIHFSSSRRTYTNEDVREKMGEGRGRGRGREKLNGLWFSFLHTREIVFGVCLFSVYWFVTVGGGGVVALLLRFFTCRSTLTRHQQIPIKPNPSFSWPLTNLQSNHTKPKQNLIMAVCLCVRLHHD